MTLLLLDVALIFISFIALVILKDFSFSLYARSFLIQLGIAIYLSSVQTNFNIISHEYSRVSNTAFNFFLFLAIIFWYILPFVNILFLLIGPLLIFKALKTLKTGEYYG